MSDAEALNKKLAGWAGFKKPNLDDKDEWTKFFLWGEPNPVTLISKPLASGRLDKGLNFTHSLDTCFKWLVPKIIKSADYSVIITQDLGRCIGYVRPIQGGRQYRAIDNQSPALALCLAIEKLIDAQEQG